MTFLSTFWLGMMCVSAVIYFLTTGFKLLDKRAEHWPALWAVSLSLCLLIPILGVGLSVLPSFASTPAFEVLSLHAPLEVMGLMLSPDAIAGPRFSLWTVENLLFCILSIYALGVILNGAKLAWGRYRVRKIVLVAECADIAGQDDVLVSPMIQSPFAWTPFGFARDSRIVVPERYRGVVSEEQLLDILRHERAHILRRDDECGLVLRVVLCLCWTSPLAHRLFGLWSQSTEICCDMAVIAGRDPKIRRAYADTLLQALHLIAGRVQKYPAAAFSTHHIRNEKMRIDHIMNGTQPAFERRRDAMGLGFIASLAAVIGMIMISATASADPAGEKAAITQVVSSIVSGRMTAEFGNAPDPFRVGKMRMHRGVDIAASLGTPIYAPERGTITAATDVYDGKPAYGNVVVLQTQSGVITMFAHLDAFNVQAGDQVEKGEQIATVGSSGKSTGPHVHIETLKNGQLVDPASVWGLIVEK